MKRTLVVFLLLMSFIGKAQNKTYTVSNDPDGGSLIYNGLVTFNDLDKEPTFTWLKSGREQYHPDEEKITYLRQHLKDYKMVVFLGTWCDDSHNLIPKLENVLQRIGYPEDKLTMYAADRAKTTKNGEHKRYGVTLVPTIILFYNNQEAGRIIETVQKSIEADLSELVQKYESAQHKH